MRSGCTPPNGCGCTTMNAQTWPWAASPPSSGWPWPHSSTSQSGGLWGDYLAAWLGRAPSTVSREIRRNATKYDGAYRHCRAQEYTNGRRRRCRRGSKFTPEQYAVVRRYLRKKWSPKQIVGTLGPLGVLDM